MVLIKSLDASEPQFLYKMGRTVSTVNTRCTTCKAHGNVSDFEQEGTQAFYVSIHSPI